jgi:hypothetical protein
LRKAAAGRGAEDSYVHARVRARPAVAGIAPASIFDYRLNTYMVISMPNRKSIARGVSQVMVAPHYFGSAPAHPGQQPTLPIPVADRDRRIMNRGS